MHPPERRDLPLKAAERHQLRKRSFDASARSYDRFRPGYPEELFDDLVRLSGIPEGGRVLEIGPGTGQATLPLARRGFSILGLELGRSMARLCRRNLRDFPDVEIQNLAFEDWRPEENGDCGKTGTVPSQGPVRFPGTVPRFARYPRGFNGGDGTQMSSIGIVSQAARAPCGQFDLVLSATAFHWIRARLAFTRSAAALKPGGSLALVWNFLDTPDNDFYNDLRALYRRVAPQIHLSLPPEQRIERQRRKIVGSGLFGPVTVLRYSWQKQYDADLYIGLLRTMSDHAILDPKVRRGRTWF